MFDPPWGRGAAFGEFVLYCVYTTLALRAALTAPSTGERFRKRIQAVGVNMVITSTALYSLISTGDIFFFAGTLLGFVLFVLSILWKERFHKEDTATDLSWRKKPPWRPALTPMLIGLTIVNAYLLATAWSPLYSPFVAIDVALLALLWLFVPPMLARLESMNST